MGLVLKYDTDEELIKRYNRGVIFDHLDNMHGEDIFIPVSKSFSQLLIAPEV